MVPPLALLSPLAWDGGGRSANLVHSAAVARDTDAGLLRVLADLRAAGDGRAQLPHDPQPLGRRRAQSVGVGTVPPVLHDPQA
ncbi:MAG TPA: hypothetical protein VEA69_09945 [Tepidisphaeraceae bacterium]|nr:hypothetical protein [Tepidisphaeraceae bacterium]